METGQAKRKLFRLEDQKDKNMAKTNIEAAKLLLQKGSNNRIKPSYLTEAVGKEFDNWFLPLEFVPLAKIKVNLVPNPNYAEELTHKEIEKLEKKGEEEFKSSYQIFPFLVGDALYELRQSINKHGIVTPLICSNNYTLIEGHNRYKCAQLSIDDSEYNDITALPIFRLKPDKDKEEFRDAIVDTNLHRRHLNQEQKFQWYKARYHNRTVKGTGKNNRQGKNKDRTDTLTHEKIGDALGLSGRSIRNYQKRIEAENSPKPKEQSWEKAAKQIQSLNKTLTLWKNDRGYNKTKKFIFEDEQILEQIKILKKLLSDKK